MNYTELAEGRILKTLDWWDSRRAQCVPSGTALLSSRLVRKLCPGLKKGPCVRCFLNWGTILLAAFSDFLVFVFSGLFPQVTHLRLGWGVLGCSVLAGLLVDLQFLSLLVGS